MERSAADLLSFSPLFNDDDRGKKQLRLSLSSNCIFCTLEATSSMSSGLGGSGEKSAFEIKRRLCNCAGLAAMEDGVRGEFSAESK